MKADKPLQGIRVVDFSAVFAGPICTRYLLDCGADVIKVETPGLGDFTRGVDGTTAVFAHFNAGKRSIAIDLKTADGRRLAHDLAAGADIVVENFRPGVMSRFGLDYASLAEANPSLVYCSISGYGQEGPFAGRAAFAPVIHASSGFDQVIARSQGDDEPRPVNWEIMVADIVTGAYAFGAIQTALVARLRSGQGGYIDLSVMESMMTLIPAHIQREQSVTPPPIGRYGPVRTKSGSLVVCPISNKNFESLCDAISRPDLLTDERFARPSRVSNMAMLLKEIEAWAADKTNRECEQLLLAAGVPCSAYVEVEELFELEQLSCRQAFSRISDETLGDFLIQNMPARFSSFENPAATWVPGLGEHTREILQAELGLQEADIDSLMGSGVVAAPDTR